MHAEFPRLITPRLHLREILATDAPALYTIHSDARAMRWYGVDALTAPAQAEQLVVQFASMCASGTGLRWAIVRQEDQQLIGTCGLFRWNRLWRSCMLGYELAASAQQRGYMREALAAVLSYGFGPMGLHRIQAESHAENLASIRLLTGAGFRFEGVHREQGFWGGKFHDLNCYGLLATDVPVDQPIKTKP